MIFLRHKSLENLSIQINGPILKKTNNINTTENSSLAQSLLPKDNPFKNIFDFTTAGDWDCVAAVERLPALHYSVDFIFLSFRIMDFIVEL